MNHLISSQDASDALRLRDLKPELKLQIALKLDDEIEFLFKSKGQILSLGNLLD
jgi:hypothetical protein